MTKLVTYIVAILLWVDRRGQKTVARVVPDAESLRNDPLRMLAGGHISIGPKKKPVETLLAALIWSVFVFIPLVIGSAMVLAAGFGFKIGHLPEKELYSWAGGIWVICFVGTLIVTRFLLRGGTIILSEQGVEFRHRTGNVYCPWTLFHAPQSVVGWDKEKVRFSVNLQAMSLVELRRGEAVTARGTDVQTQHFQWEGAAAIVMMTDDYEVRPEEWRALIVDLSEKLTTPAPRADL